MISKHDIEQHLLQYNRDAFRAAAKSLCGHGTIYESITFSSLSPTASELLRGSLPADWPTDDPTLTEFLASFCIPQSVLDAGPIASEISEEDITRGFKRWSENTTTSPSGRHLGHYKALIQHPILLRCFSQFMNVAVLSGIAVHCWCKATSVLIEKDPGVPNINRLRIIHLFEADYNFFLKIQWDSRLVCRAHDLGLLHDGQYGSTPGRTAMDPVMLLQLTTDLSRLMKINMIRFDNDAKACYDKIIVALAMLSAQRCGMPEHAIRTHAEALELMQYSVKTVYGISDDTHQGTLFEPLFGTGQGSGASPSVWLSLVAVLLNTLDRLVQERFSFQSPDGSWSNTRLVDAFVDNTSLGFSDSDSDLAHLISRLQSIAQTWENLLSLSGGALNLKKCSWYVMYWEWKAGRPRLCPIHPDNPPVILADSELSTASTIRRMDIAQSSRILGVHLSPSGCFSDQIRICKAKADNYALKLHSPQLTANDIRVFHRSIYSPAMRYPLAAMSVDEESLHSIQSKVVPTMLQRMLVNRNLPTAIRHGPALFGGLDIMDIRTEAGIEALKFFRNAVYSSSPVGNMLLINVQYSQLESGINFPILQHPSIPLPYLTATWITSLRDFLHRHNMTLTLTDPSPVRLYSSKDQLIMQHEHLSRYSVAQQRDINLVRIFLQTTPLADLSDPLRPNAIRLCYLDGHHPEGWEPSSRWPRQLPPSKSQLILLSTVHSFMEDISRSSHDFPLLRHAAASSLIFVSLGLYEITS